MKKTISTSLTLLYALAHIFYSQKNEQVYIDSLLHEIQLAKSDTQKVYLYNRILLTYVNFKNAEGLKYEQPALELAEKKNWDAGIAKVKGSTGRIYWQMGNFKEALKRHNQALSIYEQLKDSNNIARMLAYIGQDYADDGKFQQSLGYFSKALKIYQSNGNISEQSYLSTLISWVYICLGNFPEGTKWNLMVLKLCEQVGNKEGIAVATSNLGDYYLTMDNYEQALKYYFASVEAMKMNDPINLVLTYITIGDVYQKTGKPDSAVNYYHMALDFSRQRKDTAGISNTHQSLGKWKEREGDYTEALKYYLTAAKGYRAVSNKQQLAYVLSAAGICYTRLNKYKEAQTCFNEAKLLSEELKSQKLSSFYLQRREVLDSSLGDWRNAYFHFKTHILNRDSITNEESKKKGMQLTMQYEFDKKEAAAKAVQEKKDAVAAAGLSRQKLLRNGFIGGFVVMMLFAGVFFKQRNSIKKGKKRSDELLLNILPQEVAEELKVKGSADAKYFDEVTVLFTDFKNFTGVAENLSAQELVNEINYCYIEFDKIISKYSIEKIKTIGDAYMCAGGLPVASTTNAEDTVKAALEILDFMLREKQKREAAGKMFFEIRIGSHSGPVVAGIVGIKKFAYDIWGDTVNIASRMESSGEAGKVNISGTTYELVKDKFQCHFRGKIQAKNKGEIDMYFVATMEEK